MLFPLISEAQTLSFDYILDAPRQLVNNYEIEEGRQDVFFVGFEFGSSVVENPNIFKKMSGKDFVRVDYVYTQYKETAQYDQDSLNRKRLSMLKLGVPHVFNSLSTEWNIFEIRKASRIEENHGFFHGFVLYTRPYAVLTPDGISISDEKPDNKEELKILKEELKKSIPLDTIEKKTIRKKRKCYLTGMYLPNSYRKREAGKRYENKSIWGRQRERVCDVVLIERTMKVAVPHKDSVIMTELVPLSTYFTDTVIDAVFNRKRDEWKNMAVVMDVTGSMSPYTYQTLTWMALNSAHTKMENFVFFNDGDNRPDGPIGRSGGAYKISDTNMDAIHRQCTSVMQKGHGGGAPENNIEALLYATRNFPHKKEIVMIADNWANVRDITLLDDLSALNVPVHIVLCGVWNENVNIHYLDIAFATGGSVHTIERDLENLHQMTEGEVIEIGSKKFKLKNGRFELSR
jgi:hypothetical protein